jgi:hypothetical protein
MNLHNVIRTDTNAFYAYDACVYAVDRECFSVKISFTNSINNLRKFFGDSNLLPITLIPRYASPPLTKQSVVMAINSNETGRILKQSPPRVAHGRLKKKKL